MPAAPLSLMDSPRNLLIRANVHTASFTMSCVPFEPRSTDYTKQLVQENDVRRFIVELEANAVL